MSLKIKRYSSGAIIPVAVAFDHEGFVLSVHASGNPLWSSARAKRKSVKVQMRISDTLVQRLYEAKQRRRYRSLKVEDYT